MSFECFNEKITFDEIAENLSAIGVYSAASEIHGLISGYICSGGDGHEENIVRLVAGQLELEYSSVLEINQLLSFLTKQVIEQLQHPDFEFELLLPDDDIDELRACITALGSWCSGFMIGFGTGAKNLKDHEITRELQEILKDMMAIAEVEEAEYVEEDDENDFYELIEFVRTSSMLIFTELALQREEQSEDQPQQQSKGPESDSDSTVH
ncbi:MAG: hypothetical protein COB04_16495 [Gammaproteobacteria bacterium]|nr:MAG: hypothetical protein COB04_16495 [Gammaproteobacteria bacterium]